VRLPQRAACSGSLLKPFDLGLGGTAVLSHLASQLRGRRAEPFLGTSAGAFGSDWLGSFAAGCHPGRELAS
jgi:hypothetical protein